MLFRLRTNDAIVDQGSAGNCILSMVDENCRVHEISIGIEMPSSNLCDLAGTTRNRVLVAIHADRGVVDRTQAVVVSIPGFEICLVEGKSVVRRLRNTVADTLRARVYR